MVIKWRRREIFVVEYYREHGWYLRLPLLGERWIESTKRREDSASDE